MLVQVRQPQDNTCPVRVDFTHPTTGESGSVLARYVLGRDGANSLTRTAIGATMQGLRFQRRWLAGRIGRVVGKRAAKTSIPTIIEFLPLRSEGMP